MSGLAAVYPPPPPYYKVFTPENLERAAALRQERDAAAEAGAGAGAAKEEGANTAADGAAAHKSSDAASSPGGPPQAIPEDLELLFPPPLPDSTKYRGFGSIWNTTESLLPLADVGVTQLYGDLGENNRRLGEELKKLLHSALVNYVTLVGTMAVDAEQFPAKVDDLRVILINMHHLLNIYRPHQSRESLQLMMEAQVAAMRTEVADLRASNRDIEQRMARLVERLPERREATPAAGPKLGEWAGLGLAVDATWEARALATVAEGDEPDAKTAGGPKAEPGEPGEPGDPGKPDPDAMEM